MASTQSSFQAHFEVVMDLSQRRIELLPGAVGLRALPAFVASQRKVEALVTEWELERPSDASRLLAPAQSSFQTHFRVVLGLSRRTIELLPGGGGQNALVLLVLS